MEEQQRPTGLMARMMTTVMGSCREISELASRARDERLPFPLRMKLRMHLAMCKWCRRYERQLRMIASIIGAEDLHEDDSVYGADQSLSPDARRRINDRIQREQQA